MCAIQAAYLSHRQAVAADDRRRVYPIPDQVVSPLQQLCREDHDGCRAIADFLVLQVRQFDKNLQGTTRSV